MWFEHWSKTEKQVAKTKTFYEGLFGWTHSEQEIAGTKFTAIMNGQIPIGMTAVADKKLKVKQGLWMGYISVPDVDAVAANAKAAGGKVHFGPEDMSGVGRCLLYTSPSPRDATLSRMPSSA